VPRAVLVSLTFPALVYVAIQLVFTGVGGGATQAPLADAAQKFLGPVGASLLGLGGLASMLGFNAGTALSTPRYLEALADEGLLPAALSRVHARYGTPAVAIITSAAVTAVLTLLLDFKRLVDLAALAVLLQYLATAAALVRIGSGRSRWLGLVACAAAALFGAQSIGAPSTPVELGWLVALTVVGVLVAALSRGLSRRSSPTAP